MNNDQLILIKTAAALPSPSLQDLTDAAGLNLYRGPMENDTHLYVDLRHTVPTDGGVKVKPGMEAQAWLRALPAVNRAILEAKARILKAKALIYAAQQETP